MIPPITGHEGHVRHRAARTPTTRMTACRARRTSSSTARRLAAPPPVGHALLRPRYSCAWPMRNGAPPLADVRASALSCCSNAPAAGVETDDDGTSGGGAGARVALRYGPLPAGGFGARERRRRPGISIGDGVPAAAGAPSVCELAIALGGAVVVNRACGAAAAARRVAFASRRSCAAAGCASRSTAATSFAEPLHLPGWAPAADRRLACRRRRRRRRLLARSRSIESALLLYVAPVAVTVAMHGQQHAGLLRSTSRTTRRPSSRRSRRRRPDLAAATLIVVHGANLALAGLGACALAQADSGPRRRPHARLADRAQLHGARRASPPHVHRGQRRGERALRRRLPLGRRQLLKVRGAHPHVGLAEPRGRGAHGGGGGGAGSRPAAPTAAAALSTPPARRRRRRQASPAPPATSCTRLAPGVSATGAAAVEVTLNGAQYTASSALSFRPPLRRPSAPPPPPPARGRQRRATSTTATPVARTATAQRRRRAATTTTTTTTTTTRTRWSSSPANPCQGPVVVRRGDLRERGGAAGGQLGATRVNVSGRRVHDGRRRNALPLRRRRGGGELRLRDDALVRGAAGGRERPKEEARLAQCRRVVRRRAVRVCRRRRHHVRGVEPASERAPAAARSPHRTLPLPDAVARRRAVTCRFGAAGAACADAAAAPEAAAADLATAFDHRGHCRQHGRPPLRRAGDAAVGRLHPARRAADDLGERTAVLGAARQLFVLCRRRCRRPRDRRTRAGARPSRRRHRRRAARRRLRRRHRVLRPLRRPRKSPPPSTPTGSCAA